MTTLAVVWTVGAAMARRQPAWVRGSPSRGSRPPIGVAAVAVVVTAVVMASSISFGLDNRDAEPARPDLSADLGVLTDQTVAALEGGHSGASGRSGRYLVRWTDRVTIGSQGFGLLNELTRRGFEAGVIPAFGSGAGGSHRVLDEDDASLVVQLVVGPDITEWANRPDAVEVAFVDARTPAQRERHDELMAQIDRELRDRGLDQLADDWNTNLFTTWIDADVPSEVHPLMTEVLDMTAPVAVFLLPPGAGT